MAEDSLELDALVPLPPGTRIIGMHHHTQGFLNSRKTLDYPLGINPGSNPLNSIESWTGEKALYRTWACSSLSGDGRSHIFIPRINNSAISLERPKIAELPI